MKKKILAIASFIALYSALPAMAASSCDQMVAYGYPQTKLTNVTQLCRLSYTVLHNNKLKTPVYSAELLLKENSSGDNPRINAFKADPDLMPTNRAELSDYNKEYDRGHMTPFEDTRSKSAGALQTFYLSNMVPQDLHLNRGMWHALENRVRQYAANSRSGVYVITGPCYNTAIKYIGNGVAVPNAIYKIVIDKANNQGVAFLIPNAAPMSGAKFMDYAVPISTIEQIVGINFTPLTTDVRFKNQIGSEFK